MSRQVSHSAFMHTLLNPQATVPAGLAGRAGASVNKRFSIYRNNVIVSLVDALAARFPVTQMLVGEDFFRAMARAYVTEHPPQSRLMAEYGGSFPDFIAGFEPAATLLYLADMARLEALRTEAYHAADCEPLGQADFARLADDSLTTTRFECHPSLRLLRSRHAVVSLWAAHQGLLEIGQVDPDLPEDALIIRPRLEVEIIRVPPGAAIFFTRLQQGEILGGAAIQAAEASPGFDLTQAMYLLVTTGMVVRILS